MMETNPEARVLLVDDQEANLRLLERILRQGGYTHYRSLQDSRQACAQFREFQPDLVLLDLMMPYLDGMAVLDQLRALTADAYLPILMLTADVTPAAKQKALAAGATDFVTKPFDAVEVLLRITNLLRTRFLWQQLQRRADRRIREQAALLDRANDAILVRDLENRIRYWNQGAERLYGWTSAEAVGRDARELLNQGAVSDLEAAIQEVMKEGKWEGELRHVTRDGRKIIVASRWTLLRDEEGRPTSWLAINTDVTEKKRLEMQLVQTQRLEAVGQLAGGVAHDFNNLLTVINGCGQILLGGLAPNDPHRDLVCQMTGAGERAAVLTRQLLTFCRKAVLEPQVLDLRAVVADMDKMLRRLIGEDVELVTAADPDLGLVKADPGQIEQVLLNLAVNARDAMPQGGKLTIECRHAGFATAAQVLLRVRDTGVGMTPEVQARIFEPFYTTKGDRGTGLGLATVHGIVQQSGGHINVVSEPGRGTTFQIYLPCVQEKATAARPRTGMTALPRGSETVLLVEDEDGVRAMMRHVLTTCGYAVMEARDGTQALALAERHGGRLDLLLTDVVLPRMSGRELAERVRALHPRVQVVFVSGYADDAVLRHGILSAQVHFLQKPFAPSALAQKLRQVLDSASAGAVCGRPPAARDGTDTETVPTVR